MQDLFATEDDIASAVARELAVRLAGRTGSTLLRHRTRSIAAYELYLRGSDLTLLFTDSVEPPISRRGRRGELQ
jgi:hypothetical protein